MTGFDGLQLTWEVTTYASLIYLKMVRAIVESICVNCQPQKFDSDGCVQSIFSFIFLFFRESGNLCGNCAEDGTFSQYVHEASSPWICDSSGYWTPEEAVGKVLSPFSRIKGIAQE